MPDPLQIRFRALTSKRKLIRTDKIINDTYFYMKDIEKDIMDQVHYYPPYEGVYIRTYNLYRGWKSRITQSMAGLSLTIWNNVFYADRVQGEGQTSLFENIGWIKVIDAANEVRKTFRKRLQEIIVRSLD